MTGIYYSVTIETTSGVRVILDGASYNSLNIDAAILSQHLLSPDGVPLFNILPTDNAPPVRRSDMLTLLVQTTVLPSDYPIFAALIQDVINAEQAAGNHIIMSLIIITHCAINSKLDS